jgi:site-specific DNA-methyltransferase (adenine-specific)
MELMARYPDNYFELAIVDPPYAMKEFGAQSGGKGTFKNRAYNNGSIDSWDISPSKEYFIELFRISKNQIIWGGNYFDLPPTRCIICWDKVQPWENFSQIEMAWTSFGMPAQIFKFDNRTGGKIHPTQKPIKLYEWILMKYAKEGDKIIDTHLGSGSSRIASHNLGFDFTACELNTEYFEAQEKRFQQHISQKRLF